MSTVLRPVTQTADVERKSASSQSRCAPSAWLKGRASARAPSTIATRKEMTGQVTGEKSRRRMAHA